MGYNRIYEHFLYTNGLRLGGKKETGCSGRAGQCRD